MSLKAMLDKHRNGQGGALLKGSDVPSGTKSITIEVAGVRESPPEFGAPLILDFKKQLYGKSALAINKTNAKGLARQFGDDENLLVRQREGRVEARTTSRLRALASFLQTVVDYLRRWADELEGK